MGTLCAALLLFGVLPSHGANPEQMAASQVPAKAVTAEQAVEIAIGFRTRIMQVAPKDIGPRPPFGEPEIHDDSEDDCWEVRFRGFIAHVRKKDGRVVGYLRGYSDLDETLPPGLEQLPPWPNGHAMSRSAVERVAREYYRIAAGGDADLYTWRIDPSTDLFRHQYWVEFVTTVGGYPTERSCYVDVDAITGELRSMNIRDADSPMLPPRESGFGVTVDSARASVCAYLAANERVFLTEETDPLRALAFVPDEGRFRDHSLTPEQSKAASEGRAVLGYRGAFVAPPGDPIYVFFVYVDGATGQITSVVRGSRGGGARSANEKPAPFGWDLERGPLAVVTAARSSQVKGEVALVRVGAIRGEPAGKPLLLRRGKLNLSCRYDRRTGLLSVDANGRRSFGRPSRELKAAIEKVLASGAK